MAVEECVGESSGRWDVRRTQSPCRCLQNHVNNGAVGVGFTGEQRGLFRVRIMAEMSHNQKGCGNNRDFPRRDAPGEGIVETFESRRAPEVRRVVRIGDDKRRRHTRYGERGQPVPPPRELHRKQPDVFLIPEKVSWELAPGDLALCACWR